MKRAAQHLNVAVQHPSHYRERTKAVFRRLLRLWCVGVGTWLVIASAGIAWNVWDRYTWLTAASSVDLGQVVLHTLLDVVFMPALLLAVGGIAAGASLAVATLADRILAPADLKRAQAADFCAKKQPSAPDPTKNRPP